MSTRHRRCVVVRGTPAETREAARHLASALPDERVLWIGEDPGDTPPSKVQLLLGQAWDLVVLELHRGLLADVLGLCHGFVWGGGTLVLRMPPIGEVPVGPLSLVVPPHAPAELGHRMWDHLERCLARATLGDPTVRQEPLGHEVVGTDDQRRAVARTIEVLGGPEPGLVVLLSDRGRGKSSALGLAVRALAASGVPIVITAAAPAMAGEILEHAGVPLHFVPPGELARGEVPAEIILVDEAAVLPVPLLRQLVERYPKARFAMASTARGYEGTGRGFVLRFLTWARARQGLVTEVTLQEPIRWEAGDPLERLVFDILLLDAEPETREGSPDPGLLHQRVARDALVQDERSLRALFGLLVHAHYRTTPSDLHRLLDSPNLEVHSSRDEHGRIVAATLLAQEGALPAELCRAMARGEHRIRGHALPETLIVHSGHPEAGALRMVRSVRIAVHPDCRRQGIARGLVEHVHQHVHQHAGEHAPDLFGTLFGATPELLRFRRELGYELVRLGASWGARSGEPTAVLVRPISPRACRLVQTLRAELARDLPLQLELMALDGDLVLDPELVSALLENLPAPAPLPPEEQRRIVAGYALGPRPYDVVATAVTAYVEAHVQALASLDPALARIIELRVRERLGWVELAGRCGLASVPAAMRALRRAVASLTDRVDPDLRGVFDRSMA